VKRFYKEATAAPEEDGFAVRLDGRAVMTPLRRPLRVPTEALAAAIVDEWNAQGETIEPHTMPLTGLANAAIDRVAPDPAAFAATLSRYAESDLLCYRAEGPRPLVERQARLWNPLLEWARRRFGAQFEVAPGVMHRPQPEAGVARVAEAVAARDPFRLAALSPLVTVSGSVLIALALADGEIGLEDAWSAAILDEAWQAEQWGHDPLAAAAHDARRRDFDSAYRFLTLV
jgi:chaperone required for assembly of F1-ATPase